MKKVFYTLSIAVFALALTSCNSCSSNKTNETAEATAVSEDDGWVTIFDGKTFDGWRGYNKTEVPALWSIEPDGSMKINGEGGNEGSEGGGDILFDTKVKNFEFETEWKVAKVGGNSGILYLGKEIPGEPFYVSAVEYQVLGNDNNDVAKGKAGSLYDMIAADPQTSKPIGEWNKSKIIVKDGHVQHWLNDVKVVEYDFTGPEWKDLLNSSKFSQEKWPLAYESMINLGGENHEGYIGFQDHGHQVWYRNIRLKNLD